ncbi:MAG TPA: DUF885 domain-containing protein [Bryobacteraceae bacterium]|nr:DUF885 domain-containing protein [Bryobacteraceae bacterium]
MRATLLQALFFLCMLSPIASADDSPAALRQMAHEYYAWAAQEYPVGASDQGLHTWDDRLADFSPAAVERRRKHVHELLERVRAVKTQGWAKDDRIDRILFQAQLEWPDFQARVLRLEESNPLIYIRECSDAIFSLLKKDYAPHAQRAASAAARLRAMPAMLVTAKQNLTQTVRLYAELAIESARSIDPLFTESLMTLAEGLPPAERSELVRARDAALKAIHAFADDLERRLGEMPPFRPMGEENYNYLLRHVYLLPMDATQLAALAEVELARYRGLEALLPDPNMANPDPSRSKAIPKDQEAFLKAYESREQDILRFLRDQNLITIPDYIGPFHIRQLPEAFKPTSPGGFMNPPGVYDTDNGGFFFIPTYSPQSPNFYIRAAIEEPRPILGHEGIPGHFLQISIANHLSDEIRRHHDDNVFIEGWALYTEEMLLRRGFYPPGSAAEGQILRLSRYRAARVGVDVNLHTGRWTFDQAVEYFMKAGGLDREAATGEAAGAASEPTQKMTYLTGKFQILRLLGRYRDHAGARFTLKEFHDDLLRNGSLPLSVETWLLLDDPAELEESLGTRR